MVENDLRLAESFLQYRRTVAKDEKQKKGVFNKKASLFEGKKGKDLEAGRNIS